VGAAITALGHEVYFKKMREDITKRREEFMDFLKKENFLFLPSKINAVVLKFKDEEKGTGFFEYLKKNNIITSHGNGFSNIGLDKSFVRIAIGNQDQMDKVKQIIRSYKK
jgi:histidinol-phosphate/aromatic aminotransferase/cobyric acid decarboxylase-like protein